MHSGFEQNFNLLCKGEGKQLMHVLYATYMYILHTQGSPYLNSRSKSTSSGVATERGLSPNSSRYIILCINFVCVTSSVEVDLLLS